MIDRDMVRYLAGLSELALSDAEVSAYVNSLGENIKPMDALQKVDEEMVKSETFLTESVTRADAVQPSTDRDVLMALAPAHDGACYIVPKTVE